MTATTEWDATRYLKFEDERTRPARDLLDRVPLTCPKAAVDLGCGPGNSTALLAERFPQATISGLDRSATMLEKARKRLPALTFQQADLTEWEPTTTPDLLFSNAVLHWLPDHERLFPQLLSLLSPGGVLTVQIPDNLGEPSHRLMAETAQEGPWASKLATADQARATIAPPEVYYQWLAPSCQRIDIWRTTYFHPLPGPEAIVEWFRSSGLRPYLEPLSADEQENFTVTYRNRITAAYPPSADGQVLLRFPRLFIVAAKSA